MSAGPHAKTPEQIAQIKRLAPPIAIAGLIMGLAGLLLLFRGTVDATHPPSIAGVNFSFCAMMMGIGIVVWAKSSGVVPWSIRISLAALLLGLPGPFIFARQVVNARMHMEDRELANVAAIALAANAYAQDNAGNFPPSIDILLDQHRLTPEQLHSPYGSDEVSEKYKARAQGKMTPQAFDEWFARHSDYLYYGSDLHSSTATAPATTAPATRGLILVACAKEPVMRIRLAVAFDDGTSRFITLEEAEDALNTSNEARKKLGLPAMRPPDSIQRARTAERQGNPGG